MSAFQQRIQVALEDQPTLVVVADQRDLAAFEVQPFYSRAAPHTMVRFLAWNAGRRSGAFKGIPWERFNDLCIEAGDVDEDDTELDPTSPAAHAGN